MPQTVTNETIGTITYEPADPECSWETTLLFAAREVVLNVWFDGATMTPTRLAAVSRFPAQLPFFDTTARAAMHDDWPASDSTVRDYLAHHVDDLDDEACSAALGTSDPSSLDAASFIARLHLVRIGLYPDAPAHNAVFDYTTGRELTDNLIAVKFGTSGALTEIAMES